MLKITVSELAG